MTKIDTTEFIRAYARLKKLPVKTVMRNAARDFVRVAQRETPNASISQSQYFRATRYEMADVQYTTKTGKVRTRRDWALNEKGRRTKVGESWYMHESQLPNLSNARWKRGGISVSRVRIRKGWSKATWIGAMRALGMPSKHPAKSLPAVVTDRSLAYQRGSDVNPQAVVEDVLALNNFGRSTSDRQHRRISAEGFKEAAKNMSNDYRKRIREGWRG